MGACEPLNKNLVLKEIHGDITAKSGIYMIWENVKLTRSGTVGIKEI